MSLKAMVPCNACRVSAILRDIFRALLCQRSRLYAFAYICHRTSSHDEVKYLPNDKHINSCSHPSANRRMPMWLSRRASLEQYYCMRGVRGTGTSGEGAKPDGIYLPFAVATSLEPLSSCVEAVAWTSTCAARQSGQVEGRVE